MSQPSAIVRQAGLTTIALEALRVSFRAPEALQPALRARSDLFRAAVTLPPRAGDVLIRLAESRLINNPRFQVFAERFGCR